MGPLSFAEEGVFGGFGARALPRDMMAGSAGLGISGLCCRVGTSYRIFH